MIQNKQGQKLIASAKDLDEGLTKVSLGEGLAFLYSGMNDGSLAEKYHIHILDLHANQEEQAIAAAYRWKNDREMLQLFVDFLQNWT